MKGSEGGVAYPGWPLPPYRVSQSVSEPQKVVMRYCGVIVPFFLSRVHPVVIFVIDWKFQKVEASGFALFFCVLPSNLYRLQCLGSPSEVSTSDLFDLPPKFFVVFFLVVS